MEIKLKLTVGAACLYEKLTGKNFYKISTEEDTIWLTYACYVYANNRNITFDSFCNLLKNENFAKGILKAYKEIGDFNSQFKAKPQENTEEEKKEEEDDDDEKITLNDIAAVLIINDGLDPDYVYNKMPFYQIEDFYKWSKKKYQAEVEQRRMWVYLLLSPLAGKELKSPEKMLPFPWEKEAKKEDLVNKKEYIRSMFNSFREKRKELEAQNGTGRLDNTDRPQGLDQVDQSNQQA